MPPVRERLVADNSIGGVGVGRIGLRKELWAAMGGVN